MRIFGLGQHDQRREPRRAAVWQGTYELPAHPTMSPGECRVLDVSKTGAGLELFGPFPRWAVDEEVVVRLDLGEGVDQYELRGRVRNSARTKFGFVRAGVEFVGFSPSEQTLLRSLAQRRRVRV